jgi:hypothetical protein
MAYTTTREKTKSGDTFLKVELNNRHQFVLLLNLLSERVEKLVEASRKEGTHEGYPFQGMVVDLNSVSGGPNFATDPHREVMSTTITCGWGEPGKNSMVHVFGGIQKDNFVVWVLTPADFKTRFTGDPRVDYWTSEAVREIAEVDLIIDNGGDEGILFDHADPLAKTP